MNEQMDRIEKMLRAQLKSAKHVWWVAGYVYGTTSTGDLFVILYPAADNLKEKVVRVYDHDFKKLPRYIPTEGIDGGDTEANPNKDQARKKGIYHECPAFEIVTYDGKDTQMGKERKFGDVLRVSRAGQEALANVGAPTQVTSDERRVTSGERRPTPPPPPDDIDWGTPTKMTSDERRVTSGERRPQQPPPPPDERPALPDYRAMALGAKTDAEFDYAAYMVLKNGMYTDQERILKTREVIVPGWRPGGQANGAMLKALEVYRDKRHAAEGRGEASGAAHAFAKKEAMGVYNREIGG